MTIRIAPTAMAGRSPITDQSRAHAQAPMIEAHA